jgi:CheY-like chemotaxis protein
MPDSAMLISKVLKKFGAITKEVYSAKTALEVVQDFAPRILITDISMPEQDGYDLARALKKLNLLGDASLLSTIAISGHDDVEKSKEEGFCMHFIKPVNLKELIQSIMRLLETSNPESAL